MSQKTKKIVLKADAPDEVTVVIGMDFNRTFKRDSQPFQVEKKIADAILRTYDYFVEFEETALKTAETKTPAKPAEKSEKSADEKK